MIKKDRNQQKKEKELKRRYGRLAESMEPYYHHLDLRPLTELDDDSFAYLMVNVKGVNMLDLNETAITNESIKLLTGLEYVKELRVKGCASLDNDCIEDIAKLKELQLLHIKGTGITIDGLLQLHDLPELKELLFSDENAADIKDKMLQLRDQLPGCSFVINAKPYYFE
jgi:hypothetical protein